MALEVRVVADRAVWGIGQTKKEEPSLELGARVMSFAAASFEDIYTIQNQLFVCYWTLAEVECLTMGHQVIMQQSCPS